jgi:hypothetical protein
MGLARRIPAGPAKSKQLLRNTAMPIVRIGTKLVYFAHVPKCAGSSVEDYLKDRFGPLALLDRHYLSVAPDERWTRTSPQHIDWGSLIRMFPPAFFVDVFAVVRHPLDRAVSAYRFQSEVEGTVAKGLSFGDWLQAEFDARRSDPHRSDNHSRPQVDFIPSDQTQSCTIFHLEHGLDALIPYFDLLAGTPSGPRAMSHSNKARQGRSVSVRSLPPIEPTAKERTLVSNLYAADFERFGYAPDHRAPLVPPPILSPEFLDRNAAARTHAARPIYRFAARARNRISNWRG